MSEKASLDRERKDRYPAKAEKIETRASDIKDWTGDMSEKDFEEVEAVTNNFAQLNVS